MRRVAGAKITLTVAPKHEEITIGADDEPVSYTPVKEVDSNQFYKDYFEFLVEKDGIKVRVKYFVLVDDYWNLTRETCENMLKGAYGEWKISILSRIDWKHYFATYVGRLMQS